MYSATTVTVCTQSLTNLKVLVFRFSKFSWPYNYNRYMYMITCTNMYSATTVTDIHTESDKGTGFQVFTVFMAL